MADPDQNLYIWFIDVGQGDGTFIRFPPGPDKTNKDAITMLVDLGSAKGSAIKQNVLDTFKQIQSMKSGDDDLFPENSEFRKDDIIDYIVITHPDRDHYNLIPDLNKTFGFYTLYYASPKEQYKSPKLNLTLDSTKYIKSIRGDIGGVTLSTLSAGLNIKSHAQVKHSQHTTLAQPNTASIVLRLQYNDVNIFLPGDATILTEAFMLHDSDEKPRPGTNGSILKIAHHGSARSSTSSDWAEALAPTAMFVSSERTGSHGGSGGCCTGLRLPQQAAYDTVLQFGGNKIDKTDGDPKKKPFDNCHTYVAYYDKKGNEGQPWFGHSRALNSFGKKPSSGQMVATDQLNNETVKGNINTGAKNKMTDETLEEYVSNSYYEILTNQYIYSNLLNLDYDTHTFTRYDLGATYELVVNFNNNEPFYSASYWMDHDFEYTIGKNYTEEELAEPNQDYPIHLPSFQGKELTPFKKSRSGGKRIASK